MPNSDGNKPKAAQMRPVGTPETFTSAVSLQDNEDAPNMKTSTMVDKRAPEIVENTMFSARTAKGATPPSITNQSEKNELFPSDVAQGSQKMPAACFPINSESQLTTPFKAVHPSESFKFPLKSQMQYEDV